MTDRSCVFCEILAGKHEQAFLYRDETIAAFMDINQYNPGHVLIVPIRHEATITGLTDAETSAMFILAKRLTQALQSAFDAPGVNLFMNNGRAAGQTVFHCHLHLLPRFNSQHWKLAFALLGVRSVKSPDALEVIAAKIRPHLI